ncbi:WxL domain-containing protein [Carnobacterium maltaromaticum]|uniref:WxL domain-containing protein n=1 Tax=Carnobacterium maltaromaticum TaxID=2751 RepID=A0AAW9K4P9_CARML|nr:WxL domain-containing protein [Carnobacterium maltaromaticum]MDZ5759164.1 WxL domain-containing protein [Carnobacterium maltaromaticum]
MRLITHKKVTFLTIVVLILQIVLVLESVVYSETDSSEQSLDEVENTQVLNQMNPFNFEDQAFHQAQNIEEIQGFSFVAKTFTTTVNQPTILQFTSKFAANQVLVRIPPEGKIVEEQLDQVTSVAHSHGEYWNLHTSGEQTTFNLPVIFSIAGSYFLTVDNDADHFYLEVEEPMEKKIENPTETPSEEELSVAIEQEELSTEKGNQELQPVIAQEEYLSVSEELKIAEDERILEKITDVNNRSSVTVRNWSDFRSAWNNSSRTEIVVPQHIEYSTSWLTGNLNSRSTNLVVRSDNHASIGFRLTTDAENFKITGNATVTFSNIFLYHYGMASIEQSGSGKLIVTQNTIVNFTSRSSPPVRAQNVLIENGSSIQGVALASGGTLEIFSNNSTSRTGIDSTGLETAGSSNIYIRGNNLLLFQSNSNRQTWDTVDLHLSGVNGSVINSAVTMPDDFSLRYPSAGLRNYSRILLNARGETGWVDPPIPTGEVTIQYQDTEGNTLAESESLSGPIGEAYSSTPKDIQGYTLTEAPENSTGIFTTLPITVTYVYEEEETIFPVDPLDPGTNVNPENPPVLPEDQGRLSIDFASQFDFGSQHISVKEKNYYAQPQRLLNEDGTVNEQEKRPNYVQISDRRSETDRNGWQFSVTQNKQFSTENGKELSGARMRLTNQQLATAQGGTPPSLQQTEPLELVPGTKRVLLMAQGNEGTGTWIYRFGDANTAGNSIVLDVPKGANPEAKGYSTTFNWELSAVPGN